MNKSLIGSCGIFCRACDHYFANTDEGKHLQKNINISERVLKHPCKGCKADNRKEICVYCVDCNVRICSIEKGIEICTECNEYPCDKLERFITGLEHHKEASRALAENKNLSFEAWYELLDKRWTCPKCGKNFSYYDFIRIISLKSIQLYMKILI